MSGIYRGVGGTGDSNTDATITEVTRQAVIATDAAAEAAADALDTAADAAQTALDRIATAADVVTTSQDALDTADDASQTALDRIATAADVVTTADKLPLAGGTMTGTITNFASLGIDDNATGTKITIADNQITLDGTVEAGSFNLSGDNQALTMGDQGQLEVYFDGTDGRIVGSGGKIRIGTGAGATEITGTTVELKNDVGGTKLATTTTGVDVTGTVTADGLTMTGNLAINNAASGYANIEIGGTDGSYIDLKSPFSDDYDMRFITSGSGGTINANGTLLIQHTGATKLATTTTGIDVTGTVTADGLTLGDNEKAKFGAGGDLEIYSDGTNSRITELGSGSLIIKGTQMLFQTAAGENSAYFTSDGSVRLYHNNVSKFETTSTGIDVTGTVTADGLTLGDNEKAKFGAGGDLQVYHSGATSWIRDLGTGDLVIDTDGGNIALKGAGPTSTMARFFKGGSVDLYHDGNEKLATTAAGVDVIGTVTADGLVVEGEVVGQGASIEVHATASEFGDALLIAKSDNANTFIHAGVKIQGSSNPFYVYQSNAANTNKLRFNYNSMSDAGGQMTIADNGDISFMEDTGTTAKFFWDASAESLGIGNSAPATALDVTGTVTATAFDLTAIAESKSVTAVDVFVYDTSKDSDGGAWRKRTQGTSWYNEALNTSTRGSRKEFPAVAVIVAEAAKVTIYDGDDPSMPMWMVFNSSGSIGWATGGAGGDITALSMENANLVVGNGVTVGGGVIFSLVADDMRLMFNSVYRLTSGRQLLNRSVTPTINASGDGYAIVNSVVNDIAMTVLPNAPIDSATGLPIPTIAVATDGGVSVIKDDGSVVDITHSSDKVVSYVGFTADNNVEYVTGPSSGAIFYHANQIPAVDIAEGAGYLQGTSNIFYSASTNRSVSSNLLLLASNPVHRINNVISTGIGLNVIDENLTTPSSGSVAYITSDYNTGYMTGDIKLAALSDTDATNVTEGDDLLSAANKAFTSGWYFYGGASVTSSSESDPDGGTSAVRMASTGSGGYFFTGVGQVQNAQKVRGAWFKGSGNVSITQTSGAINITLTSSWVWHEVLGTQSGTRSFQVQDISTSDDLYIYNPSLLPADTDRSVNANGLAVHGTITKTAVATGADLVGYSGFSASNYLEQPYNADMQFGTGDFSIMYWINDPTPTVDTRHIWLNRDSTSTSSETSEGFCIGTYSSGIRYLGVIGNVPVGVTYPASTTVLITAVRRAGNLYTYINGVEEAITTFTGNVSVSKGSLIGNHSAFAGTLALLRISATAPSAQQIKDIYEAERPLFNENAQATLYGTSDSVTALAHDSDTNLLHVGTSAGRSVFQGLQRVDNTTTAVGSAISASNGLVVED